MTKGEAINELEICRDIIKKNGMDWLDERDLPVLDMAIEALEQTRWIPVSERLPKDAEKEDGVPNPNVLFCTSKKVFMGYYSHGAKCWWTLDGYNICEVIAWMPLPTPFLEPTCEQKGED